VNNLIHLPTRTPAPIRSAVPSAAIKTQLARILLVSLAAFQLSVAVAQTAPERVLTSAATGNVAALSFKDFFKQPMGPRGLELSPVLRQANGTTVAITGYMVQQEKPLPGQFMLTPRPVQMSEHADGEADDLPPATVLVKLSPEQAQWAVPHVRGLVQLVGQLSVERQEGVDGRISWVQLQLPTDATRGMTAFEFTNYLHSLQHSH